MTDLPDESEREHGSHEPSNPLEERGVDLTLIRWMLKLTPEERLRAAQDMIDTVWALQNAERSS